MVIKSNSVEGTISFVLLGLMLSVVATGAADAFYFRGYTFNETNTVLEDTNVTIEVYQMAQNGPPALKGVYSNSSNASGYFNVSGIPDNPQYQQYFYKPVLKHFNATTQALDYIGQSLPQFPYQMISMLTVGSPMNFYLRTGGTININATNGTASQQFRYMIKDTRLGYPVAENFSVEVENANNIYVPLERSYSIMIFPNQSLPISYDLDNLSTYPNNTANITFNTSIKSRVVSGYANLSDGSANFNNLTIIAYLMEPGNMIGKDRPMPSNMSAFKRQPRPDIYNATNGSYNITLPGSAMGAGANIMLFAVANLSGTYYGAFRNITMNYTQSPVTNFNFTLQPLLGSVENIAVTDAGIPGPQNTRNVTTLQLPFQLKNGSEPINGFAHVEVEVDYSTVYANGPNFKWMLDVQQADNGLFSFPAINASIKKINVFTQNFAPLKTSKNVSQLQSQPVNISLTSFRPGKPDDTALSNVMLDMLLSKPECDVPNPASGCSLMPDPANGQNMSEFNPFKVVMGGGKISMRIKMPSQRITVHYKNVDMLASGPPDALFDDSASQSRSGSSVEQAWRFGSKGPEIYDEVLIGVPISSGISISGVKIGKLYDENWNSVWDSSAGNTSADRPSDYSGFNDAWFGSSGMSCSTSNASSECYIDSTNSTLWLRIPHFSGVGPTIVGTTSSSSSGSSSGGSTGGNGVTTSEPLSNIEKAERYDRDLIANTPATYSFSTAEHGITQIVITGKENENAIAVRVESLKGTSKNAKTDAPGTVYTNLNIIVGTKKIKEAVVKFKIENSWLGNNNLAGSMIRLVKWDGSKWIQLETAEKNKDGAFTYFEAKTNSFSSFAIVAMKASEAQAVPGQTGAVPGQEGANVTATAAGQAKITNAPSAASKEKAPGFEPMLAAFSLCAVYLLCRKRR